MRSRLFYPAMAILVLVLQQTGQALINPDFTPIDLVKASNTILSAKVKDAGETIQATISSALKGKAPASLSIDLTSAPKEQVDAVRKLLKQAEGEDTLFFNGSDNDRPAAFLHLHSQWLRFSREGDKYALENLDTKLEGTWNGSTEMLRRCVQYILSDESASVPVAENTNWGKVLEVGKVPGPVRDMVAVDLAGDGKLLLFIASEKGDCLFKGGDETFENVAPKLKLASASRLAAWGNFGGQGHLDLASYDGKSLAIWSRAADGTFSSVKASGSFTIPENCQGMASLAVASAKTPGLLLSPAGGPPVLLKPTGNNAFEAVTLPAPPAAMIKDWGAPQACLVADFSGNSFIDVIQPFEKGGLLYRANKDGSFDPPQSCNVSGSTAGGKAMVGDFDADGLLDVVVAGDEGIRVYRNLGNGSFMETLASCGEISYKSQSEASCCTVGDFNNDSRQDVVLSYHQGQNVQVFFNRGFSSFGEAPKMELTQPPAALPNVEKGQQAVLLADLRGTSAQDLLVVLNDGTLWCAYNDLADADPLCVKVKLPLDAATSGPVNVILYKDERCLGATPVRGGLPAFLGIQDKGAYILKWAFPGGKTVTRKINVEKPMEVRLDEGK